MPQRAYYKPATAHQLTIWPIVFTCQWIPRIWHFNDNKKIPKYPLSPKVGCPWQFPAETSDPTFLSPVSLSHPLQGLNTLHIPQWICSSQSTPAALCRLPTPASRRGQQHCHSPSHIVLPYSSKILLRSWCSITGCSYNTLHFQKEEEACSSKYFTNEVEWGS